MQKDFYIFRHGESTYNVAGRIQGRTNNSELMDRGCLQAREVGRFLADKKIGLLIASPLKRALQTAEIVNEFLGVPVMTDERFTEVNVGVIEGLHYTEAMARYGDDYAKWRERENRYPDFCFEGGESRRQVQQRVFEGLRDWAEKPDCVSMAIASHGIMLGQTMISLGAADKEADNGSILHIRYADGKWSFIELITVKS